MKCAGVELVESGVVCLVKPGLEHPAGKAEKVLHTQAKSVTVVFVAVAGEFSWVLQPKSVDERMRC